MGKYLFEMPGNMKKGCSEVVYYKKINISSEYPTTFLKEMGIKKPTAYPR